MTLPLGVLEPCIQRIVDDEPAGEQLVIIREQLRQSQRDGEQSCRLRGKVQTIRVRPADDNRQLVQGRISQGVLLQEGIEAAQRPIVRKLHAFDVVWDRIEPGGAHADLPRWCKEKLRLRVDESRDQPRACNAIDFRMLTSDPSHKGLAARWNATRLTITSVSSIVRGG